MAGKDFLAIDKSGKSYKGKEAISVSKRTNERDFWNFNK